jgi:hypothetical protein
MQLAGCGYLTHLRLPVVSAFQGNCHRHQPRVPRAVGIEAIRQATAPPPPPLAATPAGMNYPATEPEELVQLAALWGIAP